MKGSLDFVKEQELVVVVVDEAMDDGKGLKFGE